MSAVGLVASFAPWIILFFAVGFLSDPKFGPLTFWDKAVMAAVLPYPVWAGLLVWCGWWLYGRGSRIGSISVAVAQTSIIVIIIVLTVNVVRVLA